MDEKKKRVDANKIVITVAVLATVIGIYMMMRSYLAEKKDIAYENVAFEIYDEKTLNKLDSLDEGDKSDSPSSSDTSDNNSDSKSDDNKENNNTKPGNNTTTHNPANDYIGYLEIPKLKLKKGFVSPSSKYNDIGYNVTIIEGYNYPDVKNGNFILAAHSGTGPHSYFKNLYKLSVGDKATVTYKSKKYTYKIVKIYTQKKQGYVTIYRDVNKTTLTLITCTKDNKKLQTIYILELI